MAILWLYGYNMYYVLCNKLYGYNMVVSYMAIFTKITYLLSKKKKKKNRKWSPILLEKYSGKPLRTSCRYSDAHRRWNYDQ